MFRSLLNTLLRWAQPKEPATVVMPESQKSFLQNNVNFYQSLDEEEKHRFEIRCMAFLNDTDIIGHNLEVSEFDEVLVAAGSVILAWGFEKWYFVKVSTVYLVPSSFNEHSEFKQGDSNITGLVGTHHLRGKMILSQPALHQGFNNSMDKRNVAIHEFAHLIDMADGDIDGLPGQLSEHSFALPWLDLVSKKIKDIKNKKSDIRQYGATNNAEFLSVATEYFFERPKMMKRKHPELYQSLEHFYQQNRADQQRAERIRKKAPCPCGSGKRYKRCCLVKDQ